MQEKDIEIVIVDLGSQYTQIIRRSLRYLGYHSVVVSDSEASSSVNMHKPKAIILSGGSFSVYDTNAPKIPENILDLGIPVLGICFGMQWIAYKSDQKSVERVHAGKGYGPIEVELKNSSLFSGLGGVLKVWASHGDSVSYAPNGFSVVATSGSGKVIESFENINKKIYGVQFHPEVDQTEDKNKILENFVKNICGCTQNYSRGDAIKDIIEKTKGELKDGIAVLGVSGGVDSTVLGAILSKSLKDQVKCFFIDTGGMRKGEVERVKSIAVKAGISLEVIDEYSNDFIKEIGSSVDAEEKRRAFRGVYGRVFKDVAKKYNATHMIQGTLATDLIESGVSGKSDMIKTHHNVELGLELKEIMPLADFFKFEVRKFAEDFGLEELISKRPPFPGPGLYLRVVGTPVTRELLDLVREADFAVENILKKNNLYEKISQIIVGLWATKTVGVKGDGRVYGYSLVVRTVSTSDFMTVKGYFLPENVCEEIISELSKYEGIVRVLFDFTTKPPATTEFE